MTMRAVRRIFDWMVFFEGSFKRLPNENEQLEFHRMYTDYSRAIDFEEFIDMMIAVMSVKNIRDDIINGILKICNK